MMLQAGAVAAAFHQAWLRQMFYEDPIVRPIRESSHQKNPQGPPGMQAQ